MTKPLSARTLDIKITKITDKTVFYDLTANLQSEDWRIPDESKFDKSQLEVGKRYVVQTKPIRSWQWDQKAQQHVWKDRYDWVSVREVGTKAKCVARSAQQRRISESLASTPLADEGDLFQW